MYQLLSPEDQIKFSQNIKDDSLAAIPLEGDSHKLKEEIGEKN